MARKWTTSKKFKGIRWVTHKTRKHGVKFDRHFGYRFMYHGEAYEGLLGWASEGWSEEKAYLKASEFKEHAMDGSGPTSLDDERAEKRRVREAEEKRNISFEEYFEKTYWPDAITRKTEKTLRVEKQHVRDWLAPIFQGRPMLSISYDEIETIKQNVLNAGKARRTAQHVLANFRLVWNHAKKRGVVEKESPTSAIELGKIKNARTRFLSPEEAGRLLKEIKELDYDAYLFSLAALYTGARLKELASLKWADIDFPNRKLKLFHTKTGDVREIPLADVLYTELQKQPEKELSGFVFRNSKGEPWTEAPWGFRKAVKELGLNDGKTDPRDRFCFHSLRHTAATMMLAAGVDMKTVQSCFGWSTLAMVERYTHALDEVKRGAINSLEKKMSIE